MIGGMAFVVFFLLGVEGASLLVVVVSFGGLFLFLLILATFAGVTPFARLEASLIAEEASLRREERLDDIWYVLE